MKDTKALIEELTDDAERTVILPSPYVRVFGWAGFTMLVVFAIIPFIGLRGNISDKMSDVMFITELAALMLAGLCATLSAVLLSVPDSRPRVIEYVLAGVALSIWLSLAAICIFMGAGGDMWSEFRSYNTGFYCASNVVMIGIIPAIALIYIIRKAAPTHCALTSFLAVLGAFSFGVFGCRLHYGDVPMYVLIWQYSPAIIASVVAAIIGNRLLRWQ